MNFALIVFSFFFGVHYITNTIKILRKYNFMTFFVFLMSNVITPDVVLISAIPVQYICVCVIVFTIVNRI